MDLKFPDPCGQAIYDELNRTGVLSADFKQRLISLVMGLTSEAYERGVKSAPSKAK